MAVDLLAFPVLGDILGFFAAAFAGWRYVISSSYRARVHLRWQSKSQLQVAQEIAAALVGSIFWLILLWLTISVFAGFDWITRLLHGFSSV